MDARFDHARAAIVADDAARLEELVAADPTLAAGASLDPCDHPGLLQCLVLTTPYPSALEEMIRILVRHGADPNGPLVAAAGIDNVRAANTLLDLGAKVDGAGGWSPLDEALYWRSEGAVDLLLKRGAKVEGLRPAASLGRLEQVRSCFPDPTSVVPLPSAGSVDWPFGAAAIPEEPRTDLGHVVGNALVHAAAWGRTEVVADLLDRGASVDFIPAGFDHAGAALYYAVLRGRNAVVELLLDRGADPSVPDAKIGRLPEYWAGHGGHADIGARLKQRRSEPS